MATYGDDEETGSGPSLEDEELASGDHEGRRGCSERELRFCEAYLRTFNACEAYRQAGYAPLNANVNSSKLLARPRVRQYLASLTATVREKSEVELVEVVRELARILRSDPAEALDEHGVVMPLKDWPLPLRRALASFEVEELFSGRGEDREHIGYIRKFKLWSKTDAAQQLMRHLGGFEKDNKQQAQSFAELVLLSKQGAKE